MVKKKLRRVTTDMHMQEYYSKTTLIIACAHKWNDSLFSIYIRYTDTRTQHKDTQNTQQQQQQKMTTITLDVHKFDIS